MKQSTNKNPGCFGSLLKFFGVNKGSPKPSEIAVEYLPADPDPLPYRVRDDFLSPAEKTFYQVIKSLMGSYFTICPKVSLSDIFFVVRPNENKSAYNRINRKHVDFLICEPQSMTPLFAIELDDSSHTRLDRAERDAFVDSVFEAAQLPLLHIPVRASYNKSELGVLFKNVLQQKNESAKPAEQNAMPDQSVAVKEQIPASELLTPFCPKCGTPMVLRTAKNGDQVGRKFFGCSNYPRCRVILPVEEKR